MPPLRERREEIPFFIEETVRRSQAEMKNGRVFKFSSQLIEAAQCYEWRGNLRELRNFVTRTMIMRDADAALRELDAKIEAFTGAFKDTAGKFEQANGGTLLLDEIGEMSAQMQAKLLHVLQDGQFSRLGGQDCIKADLRVLAATNIRVEDAL